MAPASATVASVLLCSRLVASAMNLPFIRKSACRIVVSASVRRSWWANRARNWAQGGGVARVAEVVALRGRDVPELGRLGQAVEDLLGAQPAQGHPGEEAGVVRPGLW